MASTKSKPNQPQTNELDVKGQTSQHANLIDLSNDPDFINLHEHYQHAEFILCKEVLEKLEERYPEHPEILKFKDDLLIKLSLKDITISTEKEEKHKKKKVILNMSLFAIIASLIVMVVFFFSYNYINKYETAKQLEQETAYLTSLKNQAEQLLLVGQPQPAAEIIEQIRTVNPEFANLPELIIQKDAMLRMEAEYQKALNLIAENKNTDALAILNKIEAEKPGMWDVRQQIKLIETSFQVANYIEVGNAAYQEEEWGQVIDAYENALLLDPTYDDPLMNEQLINSYLYRIISMLDNENSSIEDIDNAEEYYRRAVAMTSQSKAFASERENLQKASSDLLKLKYVQIAKANLEDQYQTVSSVSEAVSYIRKAASIDPNNTSLNLNLENAEYYQIAFKAMIGMNWDQAITNLKQIMSVDPDFANGNARELLFEAYYQLGKKYASLGLYLDAIREFEQAEILAWNDSDNLIKLFQVQVILGDMFGKVDDFENAVSYYQYALNAIQVNNRLTNYPTLSSKLAEANVSTAYAKYEEAFTAFQEVLEKIDVIFSVSEVEIRDGSCLVFFANENLSTVDAILEANNLPVNMIIKIGRKLKVPTIQK